MLRSWKRWWKHLWAPAAGKWLPDDALERIAQRVAEGERRHSGEVRVCVESRLPNSYLLRPQPLARTVRQRAVSQFGKLRVWDTEHNNGVLIYLLTAERTIELVADRGACRCIAQTQWQAVVDRLGQAMRQGQFEAGLMQAVDEVAALLEAHFPLAPGQANPNELADRPNVDGKDA